MNKTRKPYNYTLCSAIALSIAFALSSCGGGSSSTRPDHPPIQPPPSEPPPPDPDEPPPDEPDPEPDPDPDPGDPDPEPDPDVPPPDEPDPEPDPEPEPFDPNHPAPPPSDNYLGHIKPNDISGAWEMGYTGKGVVIGVIDTGANEDHPALKDKIIASFNAAGDDQENTNPKDPNGHGTNVAQILAGEHTGAFQGGVAPDAKIIVARVMDDRQLLVNTTQALQFMTSSGVRLVNNSWNSILSVLPDDPPETRNSGYALAAREFISKNGGLIVFANGNNSKDQPGSYSALPYSWEGLEEGWLAVTATDHEGNIASYANHCGLAANWCLAASGSSMIIRSSTKEGDEQYRYMGFTGTSLAAPVVTGTAALVWEAYPWMSNNQVRKSILGTATDVGDPGVDEIYGHGLLDASKAVRGFGRLDWGVEEIDIPSGNYVFSNDMTGQGGIHKKGEGGLFLTGNSTYDGGTKVEDGLLHVEGSIHSDVEIEEFGALSGSGVIKGDVWNNGTALIRNGGMVVEGDFNQLSKGQISFEVGSTAFVSGTFVADGHALVDSVRGGYVVSGRETLVQAGDVEGSFISFKVNPSLFLTGEIFYTDNSIDVELEQVEASAVASLGNTLIDAENLKQVSHAFDLANGFATSNPNFDQSRFLDMMSVIQGVSDPNIATSMLSSISGQGQVLLSASLINSKRHEGRLLQNHINSTLHKDAGAWLSGSKLDTRIAPSGWANAKARGTLWMAGIDHDFGNSKVGMFINYGEHNITMDSQLGRGNVSTTGIGFYGQTQISGLNVSGQFRLSDGSVRANRRIDIAQDIPDVRYEQGIYQVASRLQISPTSYKLDHLGITPFASIGYSKTSLENAREDGGGGIALGYLGRKVEQGDVEVGLRWESQPIQTKNGWRMRVNGWGVAWYEFLEPNFSTKAYYLVSPDEPMTMQGPSLDRFGGSYGFGVSKSKGNTSLFLRMDATQARDRRNTSISAGIKGQW